MEHLNAGEMSNEEFNKNMRDGPPGTAAGDDATLSSLGLTQADRLGEAWAPLLIAKAKQGKLVTFVVIGAQ